jgi:hypothetical protein
MIHARCVNGKNGRLGQSVEKEAVLRQYTIGQRINTYNVFESSSTLGDPDHWVLLTKSGSTVSQNVGTSIYNAWLLTGFVLPPLDP